MSRIFQTTLALSALLILQLSACSKPQEATQAAGAAPVVEVVKVEVADIPDEVELPGRVEAYRIAEVRARVSGIVAKRLYQEGQVVKAGTPLFQINPEQLQASKLEAEAELARTEANLVNANDKLQRYQALISDQSVSQRDYHAAQAEAQLAKAEVASAHAKLNRARLDLGYANVTAPIEGVARRALVTEGALVGKDQPTHLTTVEQVSTVYVNFSQSSSEVFALRKALRDGQLKGNDGDFKIKLLLPDGSLYPQAGKLSFSDVSVNQTTDAVVMRAIFENPQQVLMPGAYVRIKIRQATNPNAILIPRDALIRDQFSTRVWVVNAKNELESREVQTGRVIGRQWVIEQGLQAGEQVVVTNVAAQTAGSKVTPKLISAQDNITKAVAP
ncbi:efflux RND transporter periplasmic adaptor subunit [Methylophilus aquaticus]|uniref:Efflux RND transporter periplasmic adaptor subunit n=1 Tax=Methylophilus aquaticus TaxID=1971610 RepID=A0ABT9JUX7_9PROT|nr:efflux RND transporter periplasmic adaptor subunit [Methylophilus aquaticus]MDP8568326.1 efflux RND transporter periplasmic adaptor subunit [Methylophilus aquaticus]